MDKKALRHHFLKIRREIPYDIRREKSRVIGKRLFDLEEYKNCKAVFAYASYGEEAETEGIIKRALTDGKRVALPLMLEERGQMTFIEISSLSGLVKNSVGIFEPIFNESRVVYPQRDDLIIVPGAAFTAEGVRMGYGGGYYDRYFEKHKEGFKVGICFREQLSQALPEGSYDIRMDKVITDKEGKGYEH